MLLTFKIIRKNHTDYRIIINDFILIFKSADISPCLVVASLKTDDDITRRLSESERFSVDRLLNRKFNQNDAIESTFDSTLLPKKAGYVNARRGNNA